MRAVAGVERGHEEQRRVAERRIRGDLAAERETILLRHHVVEQHDVERAPRGDRFAEHRERAVRIVGVDRG